MRLGTCLLYEGHTLQGARAKLAYFCSALVADFYAAVDIYGFLASQPARNQRLIERDARISERLPKIMAFFKASKKYYGFSASIRCPAGHSKNA